MENMITAYEFATKINNEAIKLLNDLGTNAMYTFCSGEALFAAKDKLETMEEYEKEHHTMAMAYIVENDGRNIYELLVEWFDPIRLVESGLVLTMDLHKCLNFKKDMLMLSRKVKRFDAAL